MDIESNLSLNVVVMYKGTAKYSLGTNSKLFAFQQNVFVYHKFLNIYKNHLLHFSSLSLFFFFFSSLVIGYVD